jgi:hypothetical protein
MSKLIGKGTFTKAYLVGTNEVLLKSKDHVKECMAHGWFPSSRFFPVVKFVDQGIYEMEYYPKVRSLKDTLDREDYRLYRQLRELFLSFKAPSNKHFLMDEWHKAFDTLHDDFAEARETLKEALDACSNYGSDVNFEISPRNVAVREGKLILLDCFYIQSQIEQVRGR